MEDDAAFLPNARTSPKRTCFARNIVYNKNMRKQIEKNITLCIRNSSCVSGRLGNTVMNVKIF